MILMQNVLSSSSENRVSRGTMRMHAVHRLGEFASRLYSTELTVTSQCNGISDA